MTKVISTSDSSGAFRGFLISYIVSQKNHFLIRYRTEFMGHLTKATKSSIMTNN